MKNSIKRFAFENKGFILFIILMGIFRSSFADWNSVPTGSMKPTILEGDRIIVNKLAYDINLPFSSISIAELGQPQRGDIIVFNSKVLNKRLVKRVIGLPGDTVSMTDNVLKINGQNLEHSLIEDRQIESQKGVPQDFIENLFGQQYQIRISERSSRAANFSSINVPNGMYLVLGDNRDNSVDSRYIGFIPRNDIIGRSRKVAMSFDYEDYYLLRKNRFFKKL